MSIAAVENNVLLNDDDHDDADDVDDGVDGDIRKCNTRQRQCLRIVSISNWGKRSHGYRQNMI